MIKRQWTASGTLHGVMFLDFDWAGMSGQALYPPYLSEGR